MVNWSQMPVELLEKIVGNLDEIADRMKFGVVCKRWRSALESPILPQVRLPWLLHHQKSFKKDMKFCSISNNKTYIINHNLNNKGLFNCLCSSVSGWLLMADFRKTDPDCPLLFNPITGSQISLPHLPDSPNRIHQCNINVSPVDDSLVVVMVTFLYNNWFVYCYRRLLKSVEKPPPASWTSISTRDPRLDDSEIIWKFTYYQGLYFISVGRRLLTVIVDPDTYKVISIIPPLPVKNPPWFRYFVQSSKGDELFLVVDTSIKYSKIFEVFRWDSTEKQKGWSKVRSIGSDTFFMAPRGDIIALPADNSSTFIRENCILFLNHRGRLHSNHGSLHFSLFDIGDDSVQQIPCSWDLETDDQISHWFLPVL